MENESLIFLLAEYTVKNQPLSKKFFHILDWLEAVSFFSKKTSPNLGFKRLVFSSLIFQMISIDFFNTWLDFWH